MEEDLRRAMKACDKYGFTYHESINGIFVRTSSMAGWFILMEGNKPKLLHENYRHCHKYGQGVLERYHEHTVREETAEGMVDYIMIHDKVMMKKKAKTVFDEVKVPKSKKGKKQSKEKVEC